jgi:RimJ/RimL family protein N-acetyltransferase
VIGVVSICYRSAEHRQAEIGYTFKRRAHGHGYATEAAERMVTWCFDELKVHRVVGRIEARNIASERVLQRLGMRKEAHLIQNEWVKGEWNDEVVYAITEPEWRARQSAADVDGS